MLCIGDQHPARDSSDSGCGCTEISTGLDSSTTFNIVRCIRNFVQFREATVLVALLQPAPETYDLFDDIILMAEVRSSPSLAHVAHANCAHVTVHRRNVG